MGNIRIVETASVGSAGVGSAEVVYRPPVLSVGQPPTAYPNLEIWIDVSDGTTVYDDEDTATGSLVTVDGTAVGRVSSKGSLSAMVGNATASARPLYKTAIVNGKPVLRFDTTNDTLLIAGLSGTTIGTQKTIATLLGSTDYAYGVVFNPKTATVNNASVWLNHAITKDSGSYLSMSVRNIDASTARLYAYHYDTAAKTVDYVINKNEWIVATVVHRSGVLYLRVNGVSRGTPVAANAIGSTAGTMFLGLGGSGAYADMDVLHYFAYSTAPADAEILEVEKYLGNTIGLTI